MSNLTVSMTIMKMTCQMEALFMHEVYDKAGCRNCAYTCICATGPNPAILHYGACVHVRARVSTCVVIHSISSLCIVLGYIGGVCMVATCIGFGGAVWCRPRWGTECASDLRWRHRAVRHGGRVPLLLL